MKKFPYWYVTAQKWNEERKTYEYFRIGEFEDYRTAEIMFEETEKCLSADLLHAELFEEWEDDTMRIAYKDLWDDGEVETVWEREPSYS